MFPFSTTRRRSVSFQMTIQNLLDDAIEKPHIPLETFVPRQRLVEIWTTERLEEFVQYLKPGVDRTSIPLIQREFLQTISILMYIEWGEWSRFNEIFVAHTDRTGRRDRTDLHIPQYTLAVLQQDNFLGRRAGVKFLNAQYTFCPIDIEKGANLIRSKEWRLPFLETGSEILGRGGFGHVTKEEIPKSHFLISKGVFSQTNLFVARKVFQSRGDFHREIRILNEIRSSLSQHDRVALHLSTVTVGDEFHILSPVADMDLEKFLNGGHLPPDDFTMAELMQEAAKLAGALDILHDHLQGEHPRRFCHRDLKPANILVFLDRDSPDFPRVGKWKITDFGLSVINSQERPIPMEEFVTQTDNQQVWVEGAYQAPEVFQRTASGRRSDIWSFGCILVRILAFKLDGIQGLRRLDERRGKAADGVSNYVDDYFNRGEPRILNPHIEEWINGLPNRCEEYSEGFKEGCRKILLKMLKIDKEERPTASEVAFELQGLQQLSLVLRPRDDSISVHTSGSSTLPPRSSVSDPPSWPQSSGSNLRSCFTSSPEHLVSEIENHHEAGVQVILNGHVDVERNVKNDRPLIHAINHDFPEGVDQLLRYRQGVNIEKRDSKGNTPLGLAVKQGNLRIVNLLLNAGACVNAVSQHGITPIMTAARNGDIIIFQTLLDRGADCTTYSEVGLTCLHYATYSETGADIIRILVAKKFNGADVPRKGSNGEMPLLTLIKNYADRDSWWERFGALINDGKADVNQGDVQGVTPLSLAVDEQNPRLFRRLIQLGASMEGIAIPRSLRTDMAEAVRWAQQQDHQGSRRRSRRMSSFLR